MTGRSANDLKTERWAAVRKCNTERFAGTKKRTVGVRFNATFCRPPRTRERWFLTLAMRRGINNRRQLEVLKVSRFVSRCASNNPGARLDSCSARRQFETLWPSAPK